ncbi:Glycine receptor, alpha 4 subunit [Rhodospirillaceae bacterium LM-1]|nr:Glycine receptor, alpha 4 subunit [Rhodospirillaceae bacterium LM-1]
MIRWLIAILFSLQAFAAAAQDDPAQLPWGRGFPVLVRAGLSFVEVKAINENEGNFTATVDMRLRWRDLRLAYPPSQAAATGYIDYKEDAAEKKLSEIWNPRSEFGNMSGEPTFRKTGLRIYPNGQAELLQRTTATFNTDFPLEKFPFDNQLLTVEILSRIEPLQKVQFDFRQDELEFSNTRYIKEIDGWTVGLVEISPSPVPSWRGEMNTGVTVGLAIKRDQSSLLATIFVPLFSSLLIPLLALWLNKMEDGEFTVDATELTNISIGGLFAVVGLNFTVNSSFVNLAVGDNPVMRLFGLNYFLLGLCIAIGIVFYRFNAVKKLFGHHVQNELFVYMNWAIPLLVLCTATAMVMMAMF